MMQIIPAILTDSVQDYEKEVEMVVKNGKFERIQVDFVDLDFDNQTIPVVATYPVDFRPLRFDAHLMTMAKNIETEVFYAKVTGYDRIIAQLELLEDQRTFLNWSEGMTRGLAVDLDTSVEQINDDVLAQLDVVLVMAVEAGFGGQVFDNKVLEKVKALNSLRNQSKSMYKFRICVDGGVEKIHLPMLEELGVDEVAVGVKRVLGW
jgi:ribulose-phosphate 3-epimerase